jgi:putative SOS response-associated peptidase YedK
MGAGRWGLLPDSAGPDDKVLCAKLKNARSETVMEKPTFAALWRKGRRCLVPAGGFYEWPEVKVKGQPPFQITAGSAECVAFAGLWTKRDDLVTFTILTRAASPALAPIHSRMPVAFLPAQAARWFSSSPDQAYEMMRDESLMDWQAERTENPAASRLL